MTFTGALITGMIWFPLRIPSSPEVTGAIPVPPPLPVVVPWLPPMTVLSPMTETALPVTFTGALITGMIWFPLRIPSSPEVTGAIQVPPPLPVVVPWLPPMTVLSPMTETALPLTVMGAVTEARTWFPLRIPSSPVVTGPSLGAVVVVGAGGRSRCRVDDRAVTDDRHGIVRDGDRNIDAHDRLVAGRDAVVPARGGRLGRAAGAGAAVR